MRISTSMMYDLSSAGMADQQSGLYRVQQQMTTGRRLLTAADDPAAASTALRVSQGLALTAQQQDAQKAANNTLAQAESALGSAGDLLQSAGSLLISAQNGTMSATDRVSVATQLDGLLQQMIGLANSRDGAGSYLFAGYNETQQPFTSGGGGVTYGGSDGVRRLQVGPGRQIEVTANGADAFMRIKTGNGVFSTAAGGANTGSGMIDTGRVANPSLLDGHNYQLAFSVSGGVTTYDVIDATAGSTVSTGNAFTPGAAINIAGMQFNINGSPASGDTFTASPSVNQSIFKTLADGIAALKSSASDSVRTSTVNAVLSNIYQAQDSLNLQRAKLGTNMSELATLTSVSSAAQTSQKVRLSDLTDLDYAAAATELSARQTALSAAQQTFSKLSKLSLFNYL
jgi:flagellar hook-associated protein 3 FlgL